MRLTIEEAKLAVLSRLHERRVGGDDGVVILDERTIVRPYGWAFFYQSKAFVESGDALESLVGAGPVVVVASSGALYELGSTRPGEEELHALEIREGLV